MLLNKVIPLKRDQKITFFLYSNIFFKAINPFYNKVRFSLRNNKKRIIYTADGSINHGGIIDRMKGILTTFYLSKKNNFRFYIFQNSPIKYSDVWDNKKININTLFFNPFRFKIIYISTLKRLEIFSNKKLNKHITYLIYCSENILAYKYENGDWEGQTRKLYNQFNALGNNKIERLIQEKYSSLLYDKIELIHYRCLNYFNDFDDTNLKPLKKEKREELLKNIISNAKRNYNDSKNRIFISDSRTLLKGLDNSGFKVFSLNSTKHIDNKGHKKEEYLNAYLENHIITKAENVNSYILYHKEKPFNSHFAYYPSIIGGATFSKFGINVNDYNTIKIELTK